MWSLNKDKCTSCGECINDCPIDALEMQDGFPRIKDGGECIRCGMCVSLCPEQAIELTIDRPAPSGALPNNI